MFTSRRSAAAVARFAAAISTLQKLSSYPQGSRLACCAIIGAFVMLL
jgi:hypothetical protein